MDQSQKKVFGRPVLGCSLELGVQGVNWLDGPRLKTMGQGGSRASRGLGLQTVRKELGWHYQIQIQVDANATIGTLHRRGLGKLRHVEVEELWLQQEISKRKCL